ncbi:AraC family transcriptional regulator [Phenylobacterium sp.]|uniref:AraC family transcriptional regulator n=1 Tax=Phenylobacterium sp. TaxID=1871053 RepID=UPI0025DEDD8F|nr:AraC family transcriptional regulator [Phenylobacterium sp.]
MATSLAEGDYPEHWRSHRADHELDSRLDWRKAYNRENPNGTLTGIRQRTWSGVSAVVKEMEFGGAFEVDRAAPYHRLMVILEEVGDRIHGEGQRAAHRGATEPANRLYLVPADTPFWTSSSSLRYLRYISLQFEVADLEALGSGTWAEALPRTPRFGFSDPRLLALARVFEAECERPGPSDELLGNGLSVGLLSMLRGLDGAPQASVRGGLSPRQLRAVVGYLEDNIGCAIDPLALAAIVGLSPSHFHHAFKASTGLPPHRWLMERRVRRAQSLILDGEPHLADIALQLGFADQAHFTRLFKKTVGLTPSTWRRERGR